MKKAILLSVLIAISATALPQAQNEIIQKVNILSPNSASLGKFIDVPVSYHTGLPNISIPIYTVKEGQIELPISISYHAGGIKTAEAASWVGIGWALNAGGLVSRSVNGLPDDRGSLSNQEKGHFSEQGFNNYNFNGTPGVTTIDAQGFANGYKDGEPDLFTFNTGGYSGKFYFRDDRTPMLVPQQDIIITPILTNNIHITGFTIVTPDGMKYEFGKTPATNDIDPIEYSNVLTPGNTIINQSTISSWYLYKVTNPSSTKLVTLEYEEEKYTYYNVSMPQLLGTDETNPDHKLIKLGLKGVRLKSITFTNGQVLFNAGSIRSDVSAYVSYEDFYTETANTESKTLGNIQITDGSFCRKFEFTQSYLEDLANGLPATLTTANINADRKRLKLETVTEKTCDNTQTSSVTTFNYFTESLPRRLSFATDHWGFNNGITSNTKVTSAYTVDTFNVIPGANREPAWPAMRAGTIKEIIYPTGGKTTFEFEPHTTWVSSTRFNENFLFSNTMGFDGGSTPVEQYHTLAANYHKFTLQNTPCPTGYENYVSCTADLKIYNSTNQVVFSVIAPVNSTVSKTGYLPAGTYKFVLFKDKGTYTGIGVIASTYEMPMYTDNRNEMVGGLRIKTINQYDNINTAPIVTNHSYNYSNNQSAGVLYSRPSCVQVMRNELVRQIGECGGSNNSGTCSSPAPPCSTNGCFGCDISSQQIYIKSGTPLIPMQNSQGNHIGYSQVKVSTPLNGFSIYKFFGSELWENLHSDIAYKNVNIHSLCSVTTPNWPAAPVPFEYKRGELKEEQHFNNAGNILNEKWYAYNYDAVPESFTPAKIANWFSFTTSSFNVGGPYMGGSNLPGPGIKLTEYALTTKKKTSTEITDRMYDVTTGNILSNISTSYFESPYHNNLTRQVTTTSKGETLESKNKYAYDYFNTASNCSVIENCFTGYNNDLNGLTANYQIALNSTCGNDFGCKWNAYQNYTYNRSMIRQQYISCRNTNFNNPGSLFENCVNNAIANADVNLKPILMLKKAGRNPIIEGTTWKNGKLMGAGFNKYDILNTQNNELYVKNIQKIDVSNLSPAFTVSTGGANTLIKDSRYTDEASLKFDNGNLNEVTGKDGVITSYIWGYNQQHPVAKIINKTYNDAFTQSGIIVSIINNPLTSDGAMRTELNKLRQLSNCYVTTYTYKPLIGMTSETDPNGRTKYYEYDIFNRLSLIRDQDNNILKKICYNYAGQPENCSSPCPTNSPPNWQNTAIPPTCQQGSCGNTGYQVQEQIDINPCSLTYNQTQNVSVYNPTACTPASGVNINYYNSTSLTGFTATYTNLTTSQVYTFTVPGSGTGVLGCIPAGNYSLNIAKSGNILYLLFGTGCSTISGTSAFFKRGVEVGAPDNCNIVSIEPD